jgi:ribonuclease P/MRP protein subunit POP3
VFLEALSFPQHFRQTSSLCNNPLNLLSSISFLSPIGQHRSSHIVASNGKRSRKRKRKEAPNIQLSDPSAPQQGGTNPLPPLPGITPYLTVGLNSTTRHLELLAQKAIPESLPLHRNLSPAVGGKAINPKIASAPEQEQSGTPQEPTQKPLVAVFVARSSQPTLMHAHLPLLTATASLSHSEGPPIALVALPKGAEARLVSALGIPRVSVVGLLEGATGSTALVEFVRRNVAAVDIEGGRNRWRGTKTKALRTVIGGGRSDGDAGKSGKKEAKKITKTKDP